MNPFEEIEDTNNFLLNNTSNIELWVEERGKKADTYIHGLPFDDNTIKEHLKIIKKKFGCNGSIKTLIKDTGNIKVFHVQGNHKFNLISYLLNIGIDKDSIIIKG
jgi:translation initiation factor 1 (eIF-1/SUI1)